MLGNRERQAASRVIKYTVTEKPNQSLFSGVLAQSMCPRSRVWILLSKLTGLFVARHCQSECWDHREKWHNIPVFALGRKPHENVIYCLNWDTVKWKKAPFIIMPGQEGYTIAIKGKLGYSFPWLRGWKTPKRSPMATQSLFLFRTCTSCQENEERHEPKHYSHQGVQPNPDMINMIW